MAEKIKPYEQEGSKKEQVSKMFDNIAKRYDLLNRLLSLGIDQYWRRRAIKKLGQGSPKEILDVATGTADVAIETAQRLQPQSIKGVDISKEMLAVGRVKVKKKGLQTVIELLDGDSEALPFPDQSFDAISVAFGVRNFENLEKGLQEMHRVLRPGGQLVVLEFSQPHIFPFKQIYNFYFQNILPLIGRITSGDQRAYSYLYESVQAFPDGPEFKKVLQKIGFAQAEHTPLTLGVCAIYSGKKSA